MLIVANSRHVKSHVTFCRRHVTCCFAQAPSFQPRQVRSRHVTVDHAWFSPAVHAPSILLAAAGKWELVYASVELFRSSPFFLAIEEAFNDKAKSELFFKLHLLQVWLTTLCLSGL